MQDPFLVVSQPGIFEQIIQDEQTLKIFVFAALGLAWIMFGTITGAVKAVARERTRREVTAYIAEGSITPEDGEKLIKAGKRC